MNLKTLKNRQTLLAVVAGAAVALFATDKLLLTPLANSWSARAKAITELRKKVTDGRALLARGSSLRSRWGQMRANTLPLNPSEAEQKLLSAVYRWSQDSRINVVSISPQSKHDADDYMTVECRVEASGDLSKVSSFLYHLEQDPMAVKLQTLELSARDNNGQQFGLGLQISGLVLTPQEAGAPGKQTER
jgi:hypothetical protein